MVGHWVIGVPLSSMKLSSLSNQARLSGWSSISYSLCRFSTLACWRNNTRECTDDKKIMRPRGRATIPFSIKLGLSIFSHCLDNANVAWLGVKITASFYSSSMIQKYFRSSRIISSKLKQKHFFPKCLAFQGKEKLFLFFWALCVQSKSKLILRKTTINS